jgi:hypothetical protein
MIKHQLPLKPKQITSFPSNQAMWMANTKFQTQEGSKKSTRFLNAKDYTPPEAENTRFHQLSLDTPQDKHRSLKQQSKLKRI